MNMLPVRIILMAMFTLLLTAFLGWTVPSAAALPLAGSSAASFVDDSGKFFSDTAIKELTSLIERIKNTAGKEVYVVTVGKLTGKSIAEAAVEFGRARRVNGVVIYISREPSKLAVEVGKNTAKLITDDKKLMVRDTMVRAFKEKRFDDGILQAVGLLENQMKYKPVGMITGHNQQMPIQGEPKRTKGTNWLLLLLLIVGGFLILRMILRAISGGQAQQGLPGGAPGLGGKPGMPGVGGGGGFMNSLLGGLGGAMLGNWLFNSFSGHHNDSVSAGNMTGQDSWGGSSNDASGGWQNDDAGAFSSSNDSADWGGGSDFGGGGDF